MRRLLIVFLAGTALAVAPAALGAAKSNASAKTSTVALLTSVANDVNSFWAGAFQGSGLQYVAPRVIIIPTGQSAQSRCSKQPVPSNLQNAFYCGADQPVDILLPSDFLGAIAAKYGPFAAAYVVAHEWGHDIQAQLGIFGLHLLTIQTETQADCFAGMWAHNAYSRNVISQDAIKQVISVLDLVGDAPGTGRQDPQAHGRSGLRSAWFMNGFTSGKYSDCKTY